MCRIAQITIIFLMKPSYIHPTAVVASNVELGQDVYIGPFCTIGLPDYQSVRGLTAMEVSNLSSHTTKIGDGARIFQGACISTGVSVGKRFRADAYSYIGADVFIGDDVTVEYGARIYNNASVGSGSTIGGFICNHSVIGERCNIQGQLVHPRKGPGNEPPPCVKDEVLVGTNAVIVGKLTLERGTFVAANSVVTKDTKSNTLYVGVPGKEVGVAPCWYKLKSEET